MKLSNVLSNFFIFFWVTFCGIQDTGIFASITASPIDGNSVYDVFSDIEWNCTSSLTCSTPLSFCNGKKCQCPKGYVFSADMTACLKAATAYGDVCTETAQCVAYLSVGGTCSNNTCNCVTGYHYLHGQCIKSSGLGEKCQTDDDCYVNADFEALSCKNKTCQCSEGFYQREYRTCRHAGTAVGAECLIDLDCTFNKTARCDKTSGCYMSPEITKHSYEVATSNFTSFPRKLQDVELRLFSTLNCTKNSDCTYFGPSVCTETGKCICKRGYGLDTKTNKCIQELGEACQHDSDVAIKYSICRNGRWGCERSKVPSRNNLECRKVTTVFNTSCKFDEQCYVFGPDSLCLNKACACNENSHYEKDEMFCWRNRGLGESCEKDADCYIAEFGSELICNEKSKCTCPIGTHVNSAKSGCIDDTPVIGSSCSADLDCEPLSNVRCSNQSCLCNENYFNLLGVCVAGIDAPCKNNGDCQTKNSTCVAGTCRCIEGLVSPAPDVCIQVSEFGGECEYDVQCSANVTDAKCMKPEVAEKYESTIIEPTSRSIGVCNCDAGRHRKYEKCHRTRVLDETCLSRGECYVKSDPDSVQCLKGVCTCDFDTTRINSTFCGNDGSYNFGFSSLIISSLLFTFNFSR